MLLGPSLAIMQNTSWAGTSTSMISGGENR